MTTKPRRTPRPLRGGRDFAVRIDGQLAMMPGGLDSPARPAAELTEEEGWAKFRLEWPVPFRRVELLRGTIVVAEIAAG